MPCQTPSTKVRAILYPVTRTVKAHASEHAVNKLKGGEHSWDDASEFDAEKDKTKFRQYDEACDRVRNFYKEQHGDCLVRQDSLHCSDRGSRRRETDRGI